MTTTEPASNRGVGLFRLADPDRFALSANNNASRGAC
jgi:hypothetical protein